MMIFTIKIPLYLEMLQIKNCTNWHCSFQEVTVKKILYGPMVKGHKNHIVMNSF